ncbi:MAG: hypothetical protein ACRDTD_11630 [Pseudonocardiaceae bacterium]
MSTTRLLVSVSPCSATSRTAGIENGLAPSPVIAHDMVLRVVPDL